VLTRHRGPKAGIAVHAESLKQLDADHKISVLKGEGLGTMIQDPARLAVVLYYGLKTKQPDITEDWIEDNVDASMLLDMSPMLVRAITGKWFDIDEYLQSRLPNAMGPTATPKAETATGSSSGPLAVTTSTALM
jgi:hypothetical protein